MPVAVCLLSGGLDSATSLAEARAAGFDCHALSFDYGQRHRVELTAAARVAQELGVHEHRIVKIDLAQFGGSALTDTGIEVPKLRSVEAMAHGIPITYVPARNTIFLSFALADCETTGARDIFLGVNALDYSGYPDCRPEYIAAFTHLANLATRAVEGGPGFRIHTPLIAMSKAQIAQRAIALGVDPAWTHSCYDPAPDGRACGHCDSCLLRLKGFAEAGLTDPLVYACF
jgi:7-cyano-7-deazaguanine synthase